MKEKDENNPEEETKEETKEELAQTEVALEEGPVDEIDAEDDKFWLPTALICTVCSYLPHRSIGRLSVASIYYN